MLSHLSAEEDKLLTVPVVVHFDAFAAETGLAVWGLDPPDTKIYKRDVLNHRWFQDGLAKRTSINFCKFYICINSHSISTNLPSTRTATNSMAISIKFSCLYVDFCMRKSLKSISLLKADRAANQGFFGWLGSGSPYKTGWCAIHSMLYSFCYSYDYPSRLFLNIHTNISRWNVMSSLWEKFSSFSDQCM